MKNYSAVYLGRSGINFCTDNVSEKFDPGLANVSNSTRTDGI